MEKISFRMLLMLFLSLMLVGCSADDSSTEDSLIAEGSGLYLAPVGALSFDDSSMLTLYIDKGNGLEKVKDGQYIKPGRYDFAVGVSGGVLPASSVILSDGGLIQKSGVFKDGLYRFNYRVSSDTLSVAMLVQAMHANGRASKDKFIIRTTATPAADELVRDGFTVLLNDEVLGGLTPSIEDAINKMLFGLEFRLAKLRAATDKQGLVQIDGEDVPKGVIDVDVACGFTDVDFLNIELFRGGAIIDDVSPNGDRGACVSFGSDTRLFGLPMPSEYGSILSDLMEKELDPHNPEPGKGLDFSFIDKFYKWVNDLLVFDFGGLGIDPDMLLASTGVVKDLSEEKDMVSLMLALVDEDFKFNKYLYFNIFGKPEVQHREFSNTDQNFAVIGAGLYPADKRFAVGPRKFPKVNIFPQDELEQWQYEKVAPRDDYSVGAIINQDALNQLLSSVVGDLVLRVDKDYLREEIGLYVPKSNGDEGGHLAVRINPAGISIDARGADIRLNINDLRVTYLSNNEALWEMSADVNGILDLQFTRDDRGDYHVDIDPLITPENCHTHILKDHNNKLVMLDNSTLVAKIIEAIPSLFGMNPDAPLLSLNISQMLSESFILKDDVHYPVEVSSGGGNIYLNMAIKYIDLSDVIQDMTE